MGVGCPMRCRMFSIIPDLYPLVASCDNQIVSRHCQITVCVCGGGLLPVKNQCCNRTRVKQILMKIKYPVV